MLILQYVKIFLIYYMILIFLLCQTHLKVAQWKKKKFSLFKEMKKLVSSFTITGSNFFALKATSTTTGSILKQSLQQSIALCLQLAPFPLSLESESSFTESEDNDEICNLFIVFNLACIFIINRQFLKVQMKAYCNFTIIFVHM